VTPLEFHAVSKVYGSRLAVRDLTFRIGTGERVAVLGRNGAGKTTLLRLALGLARPTQGRCRLFGLSPDRASARQQVGYAPQASSLRRRLKVRELIRFVCDIKGAPEPVRLVNRLGLTKVLSDQAGGLSVGQLRRLTLLLALIGQPRLLVLDEPTASLDSATRLAVWELVDEFCRDGGTLLLASHDFREVARLADRVLVLVDGGLRADSSVSALAHTAGVVALVIPGRLDVSMPEVSYVVHAEGQTVLLTRQPEAVLKRLTPGGGVVRRKPTTEEVCLALDGGRDG
jgi:ABC-2 type transport system ATP-binding protein